MLTCDEKRVYNSDGGTLLDRYSISSGCYVSNREIKYSIKGAVPVGTAISVTTPEDGIYMEDVYPNSGKVVARKLVAALMSHYPGSMVSSAGNRGVYLISD